MTIEALLRVLGDAEGPSRTVDSDILLLLSEPHIPIASPLPADDVLLPYTASIDAALTLIPARWRYLIDTRPPGPHGWVSAYRARAWPGAVPEEMTMHSRNSVEAIVADDLTAAGLMRASLLACAATLRALRLLAHQADGAPPVRLKSRLTAAADQLEAAVERDAERQSRS